MTWIRRRRWRTTLLIVLTLGGVAAFAPLQVGGQVAYVRTAGISMQPLFHAGDLALVRQDSAYGVGDVVAYRSSEVHSVVLHRIVATDGTRFTLKGDNNSFLDSERPTADEIIGRLWIRVPGGGRMLDWVGRPINAAAVTLTLMLATGAFTATRRTRRRRRNQRRSMRPSWNPMTTSTTRGLVQGLALLGLTLAAIGGLALSRPTNHQVPEAVPFSHHARLAYDTATPPNPLYDNGVRTGDPVFRRVVDHVDLAVHYTFEAAAPHDIHGNLGITAVLRGAAGWERPLELTPPQPFTGDDATATATIRLADLDAQAAELNSIAGGPAGELRLIVEPSIDVDGRVAGQPIEEQVSLPVTFSLDSLQLRPVPTDGASPFATTQKGAVTVQRMEPMRLRALGAEADVGVLRLVGLAGGASLLAVAALLWWTTTRRLASEDDRIAARYGRLLVPVNATQGADHTPTIDVATFEALAQVARHHESLILDHERDHVHSYIVETPGVSYRYVAATAKSQSRITSEPNQR